MVVQVNVVTLTLQYRGKYCVFSPLQINIVGTKFQLILKMMLFSCVFGSETFIIVKFLKIYITPACNIFTIFLFVV